MSGAKRPAEGNEYYAGRECKTCERDWLCQGEPRTPGTRGQGSPGGAVCWEQKVVRSETIRIGLHLGVRIGVGWLT